MARNLLTEKEIKNAKPREKDYRLLDGDGLFVFVARTGGKSFQYRYKLNGKPDTVTLKEASTLAEARSAVEPLRKLVAAGTDPKIARKVERARNATAQAQTFAAIAADWVQAEFKLDGHVFALGFRYARLGSRRKRVDRQLPVMLLTVECGVDPAGRRNCDIRTQPENAVVISRTGQALHFSPIRFSALKA